MLIPNSGFDTQAEMALLLNVLNGQSLIHVAVKCPVGHPDGLYLVNPSTMPWDGDDISPEQYQHYDSTKRALEYIQVVITECDEIREYLATGSAAVANTDIGQAGIYGILETEDVWPYKYVIFALQILSMSPQQLNEYLPKTMSATGFDWYGTLDTPLYILNIILSECLEPSTRWNEWIYDAMLTDRTIEDEFRQLQVEFEKLDFEKEQEAFYRGLLINNDAHPWLAQFAISQQLAITMLKKTGWYTEEIRPVFSCSEIFNKYSYGDYLAQNQSAIS